jgi:hypothetical protein
MPEELDSPGAALLKLLVSLLANVDPNDPRTFTTYKDVHNRLGLQMAGPTYGTSLNVQGMGSLAEWANARGFPAITGLITTESENRPERGFFKYYGKDEVTGIPWWLGEITRSKAFDWAAAIQPKTGTSTTSNQASKGTGSGAAAATAARLFIRDIAQSDSKFFLKSEYGPLSDFWPVVAFSPLPLKSKIQRQYRSASDFIVYTGTQGDETEEPYRGRLLSLVRIDKTKTYDTGKVIPPESWTWANEHYPGKWPYAFKVLEGWSIVGSSRSSDVIPDAYPHIGQYPYKGNVLEIGNTDRQALIDLEIVPLKLTNVSTADGTVDLNDLLKDKALNEEAVRIAALVNSRVTASGAIFQGKRPDREAPVDFLLQVARLLKATPLVCALCGGLMYLKPENKLLQPSPDRIDSKLGDYGPANFQLAHLACNLGKNNATEAQFHDWLEIAKAATDPLTN